MIILENKITIIIIDLYLYICFFFFFLHSQGCLYSFTSFLYYYGVLPIWAPTEYPEG